MQLEARHAASEFGWSFHVNNISLAAPWAPIIMLDRDWATQTPDRPTSNLGPRLTGPSIQQSLSTQVLLYTTLIWQRCGYDL